MFVRRSLSPTIIKYMHKKTSNNMKCNTLKPSMCLSHYVTQESYQDFKSTLLCISTVLLVCCQDWKVTIKKSSCFYVTLLVHRIISYIVFISHGLTNKILAFQRALAKCTDWNCQHIVQIVPQESSARMLLQAEQTSHQDPLSSYHIPPTCLIQPSTATAICFGAT